MIGTTLHNMYSALMLNVNIHLYYLHVNITKYVSFVVVVVFFFLFCSLQYLELFEAAVY